MPCTDPFCVCCQRSYLEGVRDGYNLGYRRGYEAGYTRGYIEASLHVQPPVPYQPTIQETLKNYREPDYTIPRITRSKRICRCTEGCACPLLPET
jgi:hypothetical protein